MIITQQIFNSLDGKADNLFQSMDVSTYLEIGVREGNTFSKRVPKVKHAVGIDCWDLFEKSSQNDMDRTKLQALTQYEKLAEKYTNNNRVTIHKAFSSNKEIINLYEDDYFDIIFIDGDHSYEGVKADLNNWWSKCNTLFCGHDYMLSKTVWNGVVCGVKQAVDEFVEQKSGNINSFRVFRNSNNPTWYIWKKRI